MTNRRAIATLEFAVIAPAMLTIFVAAVGLSAGMWTQNVLQVAAEQGARCAALAATPCATVTAGCDSATPAVCFVEQAATQLGVSSLTAANVSVNSHVLTAGTSFTQVTITYNFVFLSYSVTLSGGGLFPNQTSSWGQGA